MSEALDLLRRVAVDETPCVLVTVAGVRGSTPREAGARMLVTMDSTFATIGGGHLELEAIRRAREMLGAAAGPRTALRELVLGASLGQCCGGCVSLHFETMPDVRPAWVSAVPARCETAPCVLVRPASGAATYLLVSAADVQGALGEAGLDDEATATARALLGEADTASSVWLRAAAPDSAHGDSATFLYELMRPCDFHVVIFGAGHVGKALVGVLAGLPCRIHWVDGRREMFPRARVPNVVIEASTMPEQVVERAPRGAWFVVMTHSHSLDLRLCERILRRGDFRYCGLIGSKSKRARFEKRLRHRGISAQALGRLVCPIGIDGISAKHAAVIAIAVAAQICRLREADPAQILRDEASPGVAATLPRASR